MNKPGNYLHLWARNTRISFFGQNLPFFSIFHTKFKIEKYFTFWHNFCSTPVLINICVGGFMQNFRTLGLIIKKVRDLFNLPDKYGKIIQCEKDNTSIHLLDTTPPLENFAFYKCQYILFVFLIVFGFTLFLFRFYLVYHSVVAGP